MVAIVSLLTTLAISLLVTRVGAVALSLTGLSQEVARFQARSAFTGVGFTTNESENLVNHPVRRRIVNVLMLCGNLGIAAVIASTIASFNREPEADDWTWRLGLLAGGIVMIWLLSRSMWFNRFLTNIIEKALLKWTRLDVRDYVSLLHLADGYVVMELQVNPGDWVAGKTLTESRLAREGVLVLGIHRANGTYVGSPNGNSKIVENDVLSIYGPIDRLEELDIRKKGWQGDKAHRIAMTVQEETKKEQKELDSASPESQPQQTTGKEDGDPAS